MDSCIRHRCSPTGYSLCLRFLKIGSFPFVSSVFVAFKACQRWGVIVTLRVLLPLPNRVTKAVPSAFSRRSFHLRLQNSDTLARVSWYTPIASLRVGVGFSRASESLRAFYSDTIPNATFLISNALAKSLSIDALQVEQLCHLSDKVFVTLFKPISRHCFCSSLFGGLQASGGISSFFWWNFVSNAVRISYDHIYKNMYFCKGWIA